MSSSYFGKAAKSSIFDFEAVCFGSSLQHKILISFYEKLLQGMFFHEQQDIPFIAIGLDCIAITLPIFTYSMRWIRRSRIDTYILDKNLAFLSLQLDENVWCQRVFSPRIFSPIHKGVTGMSHFKVL